MSNTEIYLNSSFQACKKLTNNFSTSFSMGIYFLGKEIRNPIYGIYGFVRVADEIVDTFLAILDLVRDGSCKLIQERVFGDLELQKIDFIQN